MTILALLLAARVSNLPALPNDVPQSATLYDVLLEKPSGQMAAWSTPDGKLHVFFQFNDRGRGPRTCSTYTMQGGSAGGGPCGRQRLQEGPGPRVVRS